MKKLFFRPTLFFIESLLTGALIFFSQSCSTKEKLISITAIELNVIPAKKADQSSGQFKIYRTNPLDEHYKATYWLRVFPIKTIKFNEPDFVVSGNLYYDRAKYKWENDSVLTITLLNTNEHHSWRWTLTKTVTGCTFTKETEK